MLRRLLVAPLVVLGVLIAAPAALAAQPSALALDNDGISYVGYPTSGGIQRFAPSDGSSAVQAAWGSPGSGAGQLGGTVAVGVGAGDGGHVWVLDTNLRVQEFTKTGTFVRGVQLPACASGVTPDATKYGGLDVRADNTSDATVAIYVAHPCANQILKLDPTTLATSTTRAVSSRPGRIAAQRYLSASEQTRAVFVALPDEKKVTSFGLADLAPQTFSTSTSSFAYTPSDLFVDAYGVLFVGSKEEGRIYQYNDRGSEIRWIGGQGSEVGKLSDPQAFDVFGQYSDWSGNVFVADSGNSRVQRLNPYGYTFWASAATGTSGGSAGTAPVNSVAPTISGIAAVGQTLTCNPGAWSGSPAYAYSWRRDGTEVGTGMQYAVVAADAGKAITCRVTATTSGGSAAATSAAVTPAAAGQAPTNTATPSIQGAPVAGSTLTCTQGSWSGSPTGYTYSWRRDGSPISGASATTYALVVGDAGKTITCAVTAINAAGSASAVSPGVVVSATAASKVGVTINSGAEATSAAAVSLRIHEPAGATAVVISNDGSFDTSTQLPVVASDTYAWTLDARGSQRRARVVYVRFVGSGLDGNQTFTDDILLDTTAPTVTSATSASSATARSARAKVSAKDTGSGVSTIQYAKNQSPKGATAVKSAKARSFKVKPKNARWVRAIDAAGNKSRWKRIKYQAPKRKSAKKR